MAIKNASDLLVYKHTTPARKQVTRIKVKTTTPFEDYASSQTCKLNNVTDNAGVVSDNVTVTPTDNTGDDVCAAIKSTLEHANYDYTVTAVATSGTFKFIDCTNGTQGEVPLLDLINGTGTFKNNAVKVTIITQGQTEVYEPVAHSTSASISIGADMRDTTSKDSQGFYEGTSSQKTVEISTDALVDLGANVNNRSFFEDITSSSGDVRLKYSDRIRNILNTKFTQSGLDGFIKTSNLTQLNAQEDYKGTNTGSKLSTDVNNFNTHPYLRYDVDASLAEGKKFTWSLYLKGVGSSDTVSLNTIDSSVVYDNCTIKKLSGDGTASKISNNNFRVTGLSNSSWTRVSFSTNTNISLSGHSTLSFYLYPGVLVSPSTENILTSSWQVEFSASASDYQDPSDISCYSGLFLPTSINLDAAVDDNLTYSASFSSTKELFKDGLGPELIEDTGFDQDASVGSPGYFTVTGNCTVSSGTNGSITEGLGKIIYNGTLYKDSLLVVGDYYSLTYKVASTSSGTMKLVDAWNSEDITLPNTASTTFTVQFKAGNTTFKIEANDPCETWLSSISLKKVAPQD